MRKEYVVICMFTLLFGCGRYGNSASKTNISNNVVSGSSDTEKPVKPVVKPEDLLGIQRLKALTARAIKWMDKQTGPHEAKLCRIIFQIDQPALATDHLEPLYIFIDENDSKLAVRLWVKSNGDVAEAGPAQLSRVNSLDGPQSASELISPKQVLAIAARRFPDSQFVRIECLRDANAVSWTFATTDDKEYKLDAFSGEWHD